MPVVQRYAPDVVLEAGRKVLTEEEYRREVYRRYGLLGALSYMQEGTLSYETQQRLLQQQQRRKEAQMRREAGEYHLLGALVMMHQEAPLSMEQKEAISTYYAQQRVYKQRITAGELLPGYKIQQIAYRAGAWPGLQVFGELKPQEYYEISEWQVIWGAKLGEQIYKAQRAPAPKEPTWEETTLTGWILKRQEPLIPTQKMFTSLLPIKRSEALVSAAETIQPKYPYAFVAGLTSIGESWLRPEIPTPMGALVGYALGRPEQIQAYQRLPPEYLIGGLFGTYFEMKATGYALGKAWTGMKKIPGVAQVAENVSKATSKVKLGITKHLPSYRGSKVDVWLAKHSKWYYAKTGGIAKGEVGLAEPVFTVGKMGLEPKPWIIEETIKGVGIKKVAAEELYWKFLQTPKTAGVFIYDIGVGYAGTKKALTVLAKVGVVGYLHEPLFFTKETKTKEVVSAFERQWGIKAPTIVELHERGLLPYVTQTQVTRMGILPYVPKVVLSTGKKATLETFGVLSTSALVKTVTQPTRKAREYPFSLIVPKVWQPTYAFEREKFRSLTIEPTKEKERQHLAPILKVSPTQAQSIEQTTKQITQQIQKQTQGLLQVTIRPPQITRQTFKPPTFRLPSTTTRKRRKAEDLFGRWFERVHPIKTPREMLITFGLSPKPRRRKKKRRK